METKYNVVFTGQFKSGFEYEDVLRDLMAMSKMERGKAEKLLSAGKPTLLKKELDLGLAEKYSQKLGGLGLEIRLNKVDTPIITQSSESSGQKAASAPSPQTVQHTASDTSSADKFTRSGSTPPQTPPPAAIPANPYASPKANLKVEKENTSDWLGAPQKVRASHGWHWFKEATAMFLAEPWKWLGMVLLAGLILVPVKMIPWAGFVLNSLLGMVIGGGLMLAAHSQFQGEKLRFSMMFRGFTHNRNQLLLAGLLYILGLVLIGVVLSLFMGKIIWAVIGIGANDQKAISQIMMDNMSMLITSILVGIALFVPLVMSMFFTSTLVSISDQNAFAAFKLSFQACLRNMLPFLVYGLVFILFCFALGIAFGVVSGVMSFFIGHKGSMLFVFLPMLLMALIGLPLLVISGLSVFMSFRDIFYRSA